MAVGYNMVKSEIQEELREKAAPLVEDQLLDLLLPGSSSKKESAPSEGKKANVRILGNIFGDKSPVQGSMIRIDMPKQTEENPEAEERDAESVLEEHKAEDPSMSETREKLRAMLKEGKLVVPKK